MGSKGASPQVTATNQTYTANPAVSAAANQALTGAQTAASQPFQMPVAPVAGFNPTQQQAFSQYGNLQNSWQPAFAQGQAYTAQSATPLTAADVNNVYNPMAENVTKQLQNIYGEQNSQNQGMLTQQAGGVGADRIAVGMGDLANQQGLASGQTYANLYQQAVQTAMQQKQLQAGAGSQFQAFGTGTLGNNLQATGALNQAGNQQQAQTQAELNAPYQNILAQIAYQFQTPQYLAGIAGGLAPALGGTTMGNQNVTPSYPSAMSQILGIGTAGAGIYGAINSGYSPSQIGQIGQMPADQISNSQANAYGQANGLTPYAGGGAVDDEQNQPPPFPGTSVPKMGGAEPIPYISMPMGGGHSGPLTGGINTAPPQQQSNSGSNSVGSDLSQAIGIAAKIAPFLALRRGGSVPLFDDGGDVDPSKPLEGIPAPMQAPWPFNSAHSEMGGNGAMVPNTPPIYSLLPKKTADDYTVSKLGKDIAGFFGGQSSGTPDSPSFSERFRAAFPHASASSPAVAQAAPPAPPAPPTTAPVPPPYRLTNPKDMEAWRKGVDEDESTKVVTPPNRDASPSEIARTMMPTAQQPYPRATQRDWGQNMAASPWMALIKAGAAMASTPGPLGVSIAHGISAGAGSLDSQRKELRSEEELNEKAQKLYQDAQVHLDKYNKMTPYERASVTARNRELDQSEAGTGTGMPKELDIQRVINGMTNSLDPTYKTMPYDRLREIAISKLRGPQAVTGLTSQSPLPDPGEGKREQNKWYIGPSGQPQQWIGQ